MTKNQNTAFSMIADYEGDITKLFEINVKGEVPILTTRNLLLFPGVISPILIGRKSSLALVERLKEHPDIVFAIFSQKDQNVENPTFDDLYDYGVYAKVIRVLELPGTGNNVSIITQGLGRCSLKAITKLRPYMRGLTEIMPEELPAENDKVYHTAVDDLRNTAADYIKMNDDLPDESLFALQNITNPVIITNYICSNMPFNIADKYALLKESNMTNRVMSTLKVLYREMQLLELKHNIRTKTREDLDEQQREYFLQQQIKNIKEELGTGEGSPERKELLEQAEKKKWPEEVAKTFAKEVDKLDLLNPQSPEFSVQLTYLQTMVGLPWNEFTKDDLNLKRAQRILNRDHYGMEKVKERILEYIAVLSLRGDLKSPIICLYGPPGVGKTSLGKSIAESMNRKYVRISLGGLHDEAEIRGHRRTYIGAMPGRKPGMLARLR
jgi:ATP-dependent Lon protease